MKLADQLADLLCGSAENDSSIFVLDGDLADSDGAHRFATLFPERFLMAGIAEQNLVGVAAGLASTGRKPWAFSFSAFLVYRAYDQIRVGLAQSRQPVVLVGSHAGGLPGRNGKSHAAPNDLALLLTLPHIDTFAPADRIDLEWISRSLILEPRAAYIRLHRVDTNTLHALAGGTGAIRILADPEPCTIISTGLATHWSARVVQDLAAQGMKVGLIHLPQLKPLPDLAPLLAGVQSIVTIEDHVTFGGLGSLLQDRYPDRRIEKLGWPVEFSGASGSDDDLRCAHSLDSISLGRIIREMRSEYETVC